MRHRPLILTAMLLALPAGAAVAQQTQHLAAASPAARTRQQQDDARHHINRLMEGITLTAEQRQRVDSLVQRWTAQVSMPQANDPVEESPDTTRRQPNNPNPTAVRTHDYTQLEAQVRSVLAPEQHPVWDRNVQARRPQR